LKHIYDLFCFIVASMYQLILISNLNISTILGLKTLFFLKKLVSRLLRYFQFASEVQWSKIHKDDISWSPK